MRVLEKSTHRDARVFQWKATQRKQKRTTRNEQETGNSNSYVGSEKSEIQTQALKRKKEKEGVTLLLFLFNLIKYSNQMTNIYRCVCVC